MGILPPNLLGRLVIGTGRSASWAKPGSLLPFSNVRFGQISCPQA
jgi:hypothetical protein